MADLQYCLNASTIRTTPILQQIEAAAQAGYGAIELWHDHIDQYLATGGTVAQIRKALEDHGLAVPTTIYLKGWFDAPADQLESVWSECRRRMEQAAELGVPHIIASPPAGAADYDEGARRYRKLLELGESIGVLPAMEFLGFVEDLNTIEKALRVMRGSGHPRATTVLDPFHIFRGDGDLESIALLDESQIAVSHFNDAPADPPRQQQHDPDRVLPGEGHLDLRRYVQLLSATGYRRWLSLELFREDLWRADPLEVARTGLARMRAVVESA
jgi:2-keto-myo-inositol isomerase